MAVFCSLLIKVVGMSISRFAYTGLLDLSILQVSEIRQRLFVDLCKYLPLRGVHL